MASPTNDNDGAGRCGILPSSFCLFCDLCEGQAVFCKHAGAWRFVDGLLPCLVCIRPMQIFLSRKGTHRFLEVQRFVCDYRRV